MDEREEKRYLMELAMQRLQRMRFLLQQKEKALAKAPEGRLRIALSKGFYGHYLVRERESQYLSVDNPLIRVLAQKGYDEKMYRQISKEVKVLERLLRGMPQKALTDLWEQTGEHRKTLIDSDFMTDEEYVRWWEAQEFVQKPDPVHTGLFTEKGEEVRSKSELLIANGLYNEGVPYRYEAAFYVDQFGTVHPDFTALNVRLREEWRWEHWGMMSDEIYRQSMIRKQNAYQLSGLFHGHGLIYTFEELTQPLNTKVVSALIQRFLK